MTYATAKLVRVTKVPHMSWPGHPCQTLTSQKIKKTHSSPTTSDVTMFSKRVRGQ